MSEWGWEIIDYFSYKSDGELRMIWCPKCNKMLTNEYLRCNRCGEIFDEIFVNKFQLIDDLEKKKQDFYLHGFYREAIDSAYEIIKFAREIGEKPLEEEQRTFIDQALSKLKIKINEEEIKANISELKAKHNEFIEKENIFDAHRLVLDFKTKYEDVRELLMKIDDVKELISRDNQLWTDYLAKQDEIPIKEEEEERIEEFNFEDLKDLIAKMLTESKIALNKGYLDIVYDKHREIIDLLQEIST